MRAKLILTLSTFGLTLSTSAATLAQEKRGEPAVQVSLSSKGEYYAGERARAFVRTAEDGYVVVLQVDGAGRIRPLFPLNPQDDHFVRGGKKVEIKGRGNRDAFIADDTTARGVVLAAFSKNAFNLAEFARNGHWNYSALTDSAAHRDPEAAATDLVTRMQPSERFDYDIATYVVEELRYARRPGMIVPGFYPRPGWWYDDYYYPRLGYYPRSTVSMWFGFTPRYRSYGYYRPYRRWYW